MKESACRNQKGNRRIRMPNEAAWLHDLEGLVLTIRVHKLADWLVSRPSKSGVTGENGVA